jgi:hypothetical protein
MIALRELAPTPIYAKREIIIQRAGSFSPKGQDG